MKPQKIHIALLILVLISLAAYAHAQAPAVSEQRSHAWIAVSGSGVHDFTTAIVHSSQPTPTGKIERSTETVQLTGDLEGRILYHPVSVFDFVAGTLVNTGHQVFSGTVLGSDPVLLHDDEFRFEVDLNTGATMGEVHLVDRIAGPRVRCHLEVIGTGLTPEGDATFDYEGECRVPRHQAQTPIR